jgi:electron transport complex protein RnfB
MSDLKRPPRKKRPKELALIDPDRCTGCEACVEVCPVDAIKLADPGGGAPGIHTPCEIDWEYCIGCKLCIRIPTKKSDPYTLLVCPWEAIAMVPVARLAEVGRPLGNLNASGDPEC